MRRQVFAQIGLKKLDLAKLRGIINLDRFRPKINSGLCIARCSISSTILTSVHCRECVFCHEAWVVMQSKVKANLKLRDVVGVSEVVYPKRRNLDLCNRTQIIFIDNDSLGWLRVVPFKKINKSRTFSV